MYFSTSNHYFDKVELLDDYSKIDNEDNELIEDNQLIEDNECLICLEIIDKTDSICIKIKNLFYNKDCLCDGWIHQYCLDFWYIQNKKCPICLCIMTKHEIHEIHDKVIRNHDTIIANITSKLCLIVRYLFYFLICFTILLLLDNVIYFIIYNK